MNINFGNKFFNRIGRESYKNSKQRDDDRFLMGCVLLESKKRTWEKMKFEPEKWKEAKYRESRDEAGRLTYLSREEGLKLIKSKAVVDLEKNKEVAIADILDEL